MKQIDYDAIRFMDLKTRIKLLKTKIKETDTKWENENEGSPMPQPKPIVKLNDNNRIIYNPLFSRNPFINNSQESKFHLLKYKVNRNTHKKSRIDKAVTQVGDTIKSFSMNNLNNKNEGIGRKIKTKINLNRKSIELQTLSTNKHSSLSNITNNKDGKELNNLSSMLNHYSIDYYQPQRPNHSTLSKGLKPKPYSIMSYNTAASNTITPQFVLPLQSKTKTNQTASHFLEEKKSKSTVVHKPIYITSIDAISRDYKRLKKRLSKEHHRMKSYSILNQNEVDSIMEIRTIEEKFLQQN